MSKKDEKLVLYTNELLNYTHSLDAPLLEAIVDYLGLSIFRADAELVSTNDPKELDTVRENFLKKKLGLKNVSKKDLDAAITQVKEILGSSNKRKFRALYYYFLTKIFNKEEVFLKWSVDDEEHLDKIEKLTKSTTTTTKRTGKFPAHLYVAALLDIVVIFILLILLN